MELCSIMIGNEVERSRLMEKNKDGNKDSKPKKRKNKKWRKVRFVIEVIILVVLLILLFTGIFLYFRYGKDIFQMKDDAAVMVAASNMDTFRQSETSVVYDTNGKQISTLKGEKDVYYIEYDKIPVDVINGIISIEDKKFRKHNGIDLKAITRAFLALIKNKGEVHQGASTITQQLSRNIFLTHEVSWERKVKEIFIAMELERKYSKNQILEFYLNNIYFANGYYGIEAASKGYFSKSVHELTLSEMIFLCAIPNNPTLYDPCDHFDNTIGRRNRILDQMLKDDKITKGEYNQAVNEEIELNMTTPKKKDYIETYIYYCAVRALMQNQGFVFRSEFKDEADRERYDQLYNSLYNECQLSLFSSGYRIYTTIDVKKQKKLQTAVDDNLEAFTSKNNEGIYEMQGAGVCIDNSNGMVVAIVGGRSQKTSGYTLNRGYQTFRQPGSSIKPLIVYTPMYERGYTPDSIVVDESFEGGPRNADGTFAGKMTVRRAVELSKNTIAWKLFEELTPKTGLSYLTSMNFSKIVANDYYPAISLGGFTVGTSPVEMASGFAAIQNDGFYREPTCIIKILDTKGNELFKAEQTGKSVYQKNAARMMTDTLKGVMTHGTGRRVALNNMISAGKTGTTDDKKDGWFVGYTPYYTTSVWVGYDIPKSVSDLSGATYPGRIWKQYMEWLHEGLESKEFPEYMPTESKVDTEIEDEPTEEPEMTEEPEESGDPFWDDENDGLLTSDDVILDEDDEEDDKPLETKEPQPEVTEEPIVSTEPPVADNLDEEDTFEDEDLDDWYEGDDNQDNEDGNFDHIPNTGQEEEPYEPEVDTGDKEDVFDDLPDQDVYE